jgi:peptide chain release factor 1
MIDDAYLARLRSRIEGMEAELSRPETAAQQQRYRAMVAEHRHLKELQGKAELFVRLTREHAEATALAEVIGGDASLRELARAELEELNKSLPAAHHDLRIALLPPDPDDSRNTIVEIRAGTGGNEAGLFAGDLFRMYARYAEARGWTVSVMDSSPGEAGGYKEIVFSVEGENVFRTLRYESGGHRVQRIPVTEANGRIHTSAATVVAMPEATETDEVEIRPEDIRIDLFRASGAGGQKVNKTESAVRITHMPSGIVVQCQDERSQHRNKDKAMKALSTRLLDRARQEEQAKQASERKTLVGSGDRSDRIRTYNFPQNRVTDHRINLTLYSLDRVIEGNLEPLVSAIYERDVEERLKQHLDPDAK